MLWSLAIFSPDFMQIVYNVVDTTTTTVRAMVIRVSEMGMGMVLIRLLYTHLAVLQFACFVCILRALDERFSVHVSICI